MSLVPDGFTRRTRGSGFNRDASPDGGTAGHHQSPLVILADLWTRRVEPIDATGCMSLPFPLFGAEEGAWLPAQTIYPDMIQVV